MELKSVSMHHGPIFALLVALVFASMGAHLLHLSPMANNMIVLGLALLMAGLVAAWYMGLKWESKMVDWIVVIPVVLLTILAGVILPDISGFSFGFLTGH